MEENREYDDELEKAEAELAESEGYSETPPSDIVAFNELRSCADLVRMHTSMQLIIKPDFQRDVVWPNTAQSRFIDSLVKQLPIPSMCLSLDYKTEKRLMIDGLQRISSIIRFLTDDDWRLSSIDDIDSRISGRTVSHIREKHSEIYSRIENLTIPITVLRCDYSKKSHLQYLFTIFHRLNTGGNKLSNQEIRNCIFAGNFNDLLKEIVGKSETRELLGLETDKSYRFSYEELFLRVFAFSETLDSYNGRLARYLNDYMESKKNISDTEIQDKRNAIFRCIILLYKNILDGVRLPKISKTTIESIMVGIYENIDNLETESNKDLLRRYETLRKDPHFSIESLSEGLAATEKVKARITKAVNIFS